MMQPSGIASALPGQGAAGMAPGQAMPGQLPFNVPKSSGIDPANMTARLKGMPLGQLSALFAQAQQSRDPMVQAQLLPIAAALSAAAKAAQMQQAGAGQAAMQQAAQMQQQPPVVQQIAQQAAQQQQEQRPTLDARIQMLQKRAEQAAKAGRIAEAEQLLDMVKEEEYSDFTRKPEQGYASGGAVQKFVKGGNPEIEAILAKGPYERTPEDNAKLEAAGYTLERKKLNFSPETSSRLEGIGKFLTSPFDAAISAGQDISDDWQKIKNRSIKPAPAPVGDQGDPYSGWMAQQLNRAQTPPNGIAAPQSQGASAQLPYRGSRAGAATLASTPTSTTPVEDQGVVQLLNNRLSEMRTSMNEPDEILAGQQGLDALMRKNIDLASSDAKSYADEIRAERDRRLAAAKNNFWSSLGGVSTKKGEVFGSLLDNISRATSGQATAETEANKEYLQGRREGFREQAAIRQLEQLEAQRQQAVREKRFDRAEAIRNQMYTLQVDIAKYRAERSEKDRQLGIQELGARAQQASAQAALLQAQRPAGEIQLLQYLSDPRRLAEYKAIEAMRGEPARDQKLFEDYTKNAITLQAQGITSFAQYKRMFDEAYGKKNQQNTGSDPLGLR